jgi:hypothetical protein
MIGTQLSQLTSTIPTFDENTTTQIFVTVG